MPLSLPGCMRQTTAAGKALSAMGVVCQSHCEFWPPEGLSALQALLDEWLAASLTATDNDD